MKKGTMKNNYKIFTLAVMLGGTSYGALVHQYDLNNSLADNLGGPSVVSNGGVLGATGYTFNFAQGLSLSNAGISNVYTIDMLISFDTVCSNKWCKVIDFSNLTSDNGLYNSPSNFEAFWVGGIIGTGTVAVGTNPAQITLSRDAAGNVKSYLNGALQFSFVDTTNQAVFSAANNIMWFLQDEGNQGNPGEHPKGFVDYIKIYDKADALSTTPEPASFLLCLGGLAGVCGLKRRRARN